MSSTTNIAGSARRGLLGLALLGSMAVWIGAPAAHANAAHAYMVAPQIGVNANTLDVYGQYFTRAGTVQVYVQDTDTGLWFNANGATTTSQVPNGYARAGAFTIVTTCGQRPHRCYRANPQAGSFVYALHITAPACSWANDSLEVSALDTRSGQWTSATVDYNYTGTCQTYDSQDAPSPPDSQDPPSPPDNGD